MDPLELKFKDQLDHGLIDTESDRSNSSTKSRRAHRINNLLKQERKDIANLDDEFLTRICDNSAPDIVNDIVTNSNLARGFDDLGKINI